MKLHGLLSLFIACVTGSLMSMDQDAKQLKSLLDNDKKMSKNDIAPSKFMLSNTGTIYYNAHYSDYGLLCQKVHEDNLRGKNFIDVFPFEQTSDFTTFNLACRKAEEKMQKINVIFVIDGYLRSMKIQPILYSGYNKTCFLVTIRNWRINFK